MLWKCDEVVSISVEIVCIGKFPANTGSFYGPTVRQLTIVKIH